MSKRLSNRFSKAKDVTPKGKTVDHYYRTINGRFFNQSTDQEQPMWSKMRSMLSGVKC